MCRCESALAGQPAARAARRSTRSLMAAGSAASSAVGRSVSRLSLGRGQLIEGIRIGAEQGRRPGQRFGCSRTENLGEHRHQLPAHRDPGKTRDRRSADLPMRPAPAPRRRPRSAHAGPLAAAAGTGPSGRPSRPASARPIRGRGPSSTVSAWSSRVCPSRIAAAPVRSAAWFRAVYLACRAAASGPGFCSPSDLRTVTVTLSTGSSPVRLASPRPAPLRRQSQAAGSGRR